MFTTSGFPHARNNDEDDIEALAKSVGVLRRRPRLGFVATCGCGVVLTDSSQVMCGRCATR